jgi:YD repeat-containing protein
VKNRLTQVTDPNTGVTAYAYDGTGNLLTVTDAKNQVTTFAYDGRNRLLSTTDPLGKIEALYLRRQRQPAHQNYAQERDHHLRLRCREPIAQ